MNYAKYKNQVFNLWNNTFNANIRPFQHYNFSKLIRMKSFLLVCKYNSIISNMNKIYNYSSRLLGRTFVNKFVEVMYCDLLTGGSNVNELEKTIKSLEKENVISIIDYCREFLTKDEEKNAENIVKTYIKTIDLAVQNSNKNFIAVKISSLCDIENLKIYNSIQEIFHEIEKFFTNDINVSLSTINETIGKLKNRLYKVKLEEMTQDQLILLKEKFSSSIGINIIDMLVRYNPKEIDLLKVLFNVEDNVLQYGIVFHERVNRILKYAVEKRCSVMIDAEQSYIQNVIDNCSKFYAYHYNREFCTVIQTIQCYLKESICKFQDFFDFVKRNNLKLGIKMVRGAYMTEESRLAKRLNYENPIFSTIDETHNAYNSLIEKILVKTNENDKIIIASHNEDSIAYTVKYLNEENKNSIYAAQLVGISEHMTIISKKNNLQTCKYIPFGEIEIMIPYLIRRAEESAIMSKLKIQNSYLNEEIMLRLIRPLGILMILMFIHIRIKNNF